MLACTYHVLWSAWVSVVCYIRVFSTALLYNMIIIVITLLTLGIIQCNTTAVKAHRDGTVCNRNQRSITSLNTLSPSATQLTVATYGSNGGRQSEGG